MFVKPCLIGHFLLIFVGAIPPKFRWVT